MDKQFESFLNDLAGELKKAAECPVWDIPMNHRTKDSISAFRASVGVMSAIVVKLVAERRAPADQTKQGTNEVGLDLAESQPEHNVVSAAAIVDELFGAEDAAKSDVAAQPLAPEPERLFDADADKPRRRRSHGDRDAS